MEAIQFKGQRKAIRALALSITALLFLVNARAEPLTSVNRTKTPAKSTKNSKGEFERLVQMLLARGSDKKLGNNLAPVIGLTTSHDVKQQDIVIKMTEQGADLRSCFIVFSDDERKAPMCLFMKRAKQTLSTMDSQYYRVSLSGKLEKAVGLQGRRTAEQAIRGSAVTTERDIESPETKKEFDAEMAYWLKEWLKKESKTPVKAASVTPTVGKTATAAL